MGILKLEDFSETFSTWPEFPDWADFFPDLNDNFSLKFDPPSSNSSGMTVLLSIKDDLSWLLCEGAYDISEPAIDLESLLWLH